MALGGEVTYIVGPPGTGKTLTLAAIALEHLRADRAVLIVAHTNIAIDNAIMKLCDLCKDTGNKGLLGQGQVVRYGTVQKDELKQKEKYAEVYLPKVAQLLGVTLHQQRESLKKSLSELDQKIASLRQSQNEEQYRFQRTDLERQLASLQKELDSLEQEERRRISSLRSQKDKFVLDLQKIGHELTEANQYLAGSQGRSRRNKSGSCSTQTR